jgi:hypothetical protein
MPSKAYPLPEWLPDQPGSGLSIARNVRAIANGYAPIGGPQAVTPALSFAFNGGNSFLASDGSSTLLVAGGTHLYRYTGSAWIDVYADGAIVQPWRLAQFGDNVIGANGQLTESYNLLTQAITHPTDAPNLIDVVQARDFVMGITTDNALQWCQFNNSGVWTTGTNQADKQPSLWGQLRRLIGGEYIIAITDRSVVRGTYVGVEGGLDIIWQFDEISQEIGCMADGSVSNVGRLIFFLSERGFMMCDGNEVLPIADEKFNRWFFSAYSRADIANIWSAIDPRNSEVLWAMPGTPGTIIAYNWVLKRAYTLQLGVTGLMTGYSSATSLDALDAIYGNLDAIPISLDDPSLQGGNPILLIAGTDNKLYALTGDNLEATLQLDNIEPASGKRSRIREIRLVSDTTTASATIDARMRAGDAENIRSASTMRSNGKLPIRANGRYNTLKVTIPPATDWSYIQGCELEFEAGDAR